MAAQDFLRELQEFDVNDIDFENVGSWPMPVKIVSWALVFIAVIALGYYFNIKDLQRELATIEQKEGAFKTEFEQKAYKAANLEAHRQQMIEMEASFGVLLSQLPSDTEVPGLLEDITNKGIESGLEISSITLGEEIAQEIYIELPIEIEVVGSYHDLGAFVSGISGLPRIVTLHDFDITQDEASNSLQMKITTKTYRYKDLEAEDAL